MKSQNKLPYKGTKIGIILYCTLEIIYQEKSVVKCLKCWNKKKTDNLQFGIQWNYYSEIKERERERKDFSPDKQKLRKLLASAHLPCKKLWDKFFDAEKYVTEVQIYIINEAKGKIKDTYTLNILMSY